MLCKRVAFQYESEIRVFLIPKNEDNYFKKGLMVDVSLKNITRSYTISPTAKSVQEVIKDGLKANFQIKNVNCATLYDSVVNQVLNW